MFNWKKRSVGDWCWLYDNHKNRMRNVKVLEVIEMCRHGFDQEYYIVEAYCPEDSFPMFASQAQLKDSKED